MLECPLNVNFDWSTTSTYKGEYIRKPVRQMCEYFRVEEEHLVLCPLGIPVTLLPEKLVLPISIIDYWHFVSTLTWFVKALWSVPIQSKLWIPNIQCTVWMEEKTVARLLPTQNNKSPQKCGYVCVWLSAGFEPMIPSIGAVHYHTHCH
jgi:hypothetical protein